MAQIGVWTAGENEQSHAQVRNIYVGWIAQDVVGFLINLLPFRSAELDSLSTMNVFVRAAEARSFTEAGHNLGISSSAVGKSIARLEERVGVRLFHRSTRSIALTQEGRLFLDSCRRIFSEVETIEQEFAQSRGAAKGRLRVSLPLVGTLMMPALRGFIASYPQVELDMDFTDRLVDVVDEGFDVVVRTGEGMDSRLKSRVLGTYHLQVVGSPGYLARAGAPLVPPDLLNHACLHHRYPTSGLLQRWPFKDAQHGADLALPITATSSTVEPLILLAERGAGLTCVPDFFTREQVADGRLVVLLADHIEHSKVIRAVWPSSRQNSPKLRVFVDFLVQHLFSLTDDVVSR